MAEWAIQIGRFDIRYASTSINCFSASPWEGHLTRLVNIFGYLQCVPGRRKIIVVSPEDIGDTSGKGANVKYGLENYPGASEEIEDPPLEPRGLPFRNTVYFDSDHAHDHVTRQSVSSVLSFVGSTPFGWTSKRHGTIESSSFSA